MMIAQETFPTSIFELRKLKFERLGFLVTLLFVVVVLGLASVITISGAVLAPGNIVQTGENKEIQHTVGGPVSEIFVENGALVKQGEVLIVLDDANIIAQQKVLTKRKVELGLSLDRLNALQKQEAINFYDAKYQATQGSYPEVISRQTSLFEAQKERMTNAKVQLETRIKGLRHELLALNQQINTSKQQLDFLDESIEEISELYAEQLVSKSRLTGLRREKITALTEIDALNLSKARSLNALNDAKNQLDVMVKENQERLWLEIDEVTNEFAEAEQSLIASNDTLSRLEITAPASGRVHELSIKNIDAVVTAGQVIMQIVPESTGPAVNVRVTPLDIEQVYIGQEARIRFDSFDADTTPELKGEVSKISPDTSTDESTGEIYYSVIVTISAEVLGELNSDLAVIPGLPVSTMITTNERSILNYVLKPFISKMFAAFRDG